ncbi:Signal transduction histidine kinase [Yoonia rosea]|uniref:histidine kinase n=1 Tax=Yoonia rosea TaxID=287098 RepID=A0A1R3WZN8_9RHOB|nr:Signal transduction histidine kinase [Yoonia rosea]
MKNLRPPRRWHSLTLPGQFLLAGAAVMVVATIAVEFWVSKRIEDAVVNNSAFSAALLMENFISPLSQELADTDTLSQPARQALAEVFNGTPIGERVVSYKIWSTDGLVIHASDPSIIGQEFEPSEDFLRAASGYVSASFEDFDDIEDATEAALGVPLLEVYSPIRQLWSGEIIGVAEFYEDATILREDILSAHRTSWLVVGGAFLASGVLLFGIVQAGGRTIRQQQSELRRQLDKTQTVSTQNADLRRKVIKASTNATAQTERAIRRIGSDLHDGPAQYLSLASLRLDNALNGQQGPSGDSALVRESLDKALDELRIISRGLALPDLDNLDVQALINRAVNDHMRQTDLEIEVQAQGVSEITLNYAQKLCVFRFLQETLSNVRRHAKVDEATVSVRTDPQFFYVSVVDLGTGFETTAPRNVRDDGGQGLFGLINRAESIGGQLDITSTTARGTTLTLTLPIEEANL